MITCQCNCGSVQFEILTPVSDIYVCHCSICRKLTGDRGISVVVLKNADFRWTSSGDVRTVWQKPNADWDANFCSVCGSSLPGKNDENTMFVPAGLLPGGLDGLQVKHHIFVNSKASWDVIGDSGKQHEDEFSG